MRTPKVIVTRRWPEQVETKLKELYEVQFNENDQPMSAEQLKEALRSADAVLPTVTDPITADVLSAKPLRCKILGNFGVGFNHIDIDAAKDRGIVVYKYSRRTNRLHCRYRYVAHVIRCASRSRR